MTNFKKRKKATKHIYKTKKVYMPVVVKDPKLVEQLEYFRKLLSGLKRPGSKCPNA